MTGSGNTGEGYEVPARSSLKGVTPELWETVVNEAYAANVVRNDRGVIRAVKNHANRLLVLENRRAVRTDEAYQELRDMAQSGELEGRDLINAYEILTEFGDPEGFNGVLRLGILYDKLNKPGVLFATYDYDDQLLIGRTVEGSDDTPTVAPVIRDDSTMIFKVLATQEDEQDSGIIGARPIHVTLGKENIEAILAATLINVRSMTTSDTDRCDRMIEIATQYKFIAHEKSPSVLVAVAEYVAEVLPGVIHDADSTEEASRMIGYLLTYDEVALNRIDNDEAWRCVEGKPGDGTITNAMNYIKALVMARNPEFSELSRKDQQELEWGEWQALCSHGWNLDNGEQSDRHIRTNSPFHFPQH